MGKKLVIVESPAKVKTISKFLGPGYKVMASYGHCYQINPKGLSIDIDNGYEPKYVPCEDKKNVIKDIKANAKKCDMVYIATDPDREGEAIAANIRDFIIAGSTPTQRVTFHEITKKAIKDAFKTPSVVDENMYLSQKARSVVDRLVGYKVSPVLWKKVCKGTSAGRVQSIGLKMIVERQKEIDSFVPEEYWTIKGYFSIEGNNVSADYKSKDSIKDKSAVNNILKSIDESGPWSISDIKDSQNKNSPGPIFKTSTLQQTASSLLGWSSKKTMQVAQSLYEGFSVQGGEQSGLITYHRTDSLNISKEAMDACRDLILKDYGPDYLPAKPRYFKTNNKSAQEAHEGIRPTHLEYPLSVIKQSIPIDAYKLYELIYRKFVASQMKPAITSTTTLTISSSNNKHSFIVVGQREIFDGYYAAWVYSNKKYITLPEVKSGSTADMERVEPTQHFTKPPAYFNDGSLVKVLEEDGVGRPSTYASIIDTLLKRKYVSREGKKLKAEELGILISDYLSKEFPELMDNKYTSRVESKLDDISNGAVEWDSVVDTFYKELEQRVDAAYQSSGSKSSEDSGILCPVCKKHNLFVRRSKYGKFYGCSGFQEKGKDKCKATFQIGSDGLPVAKKGPEYLEGHVCDVCGSKIVARVASKGKNKGNKFYGCSGYPKCRRVFDENGKPIEYKKKPKQKKS